MDERRRAQRLRVLKAGSISFNRASSIDCHVRNMSPVAACLEVASQVGVPNDFILIVNHDRISRPCHVIWRSEKRIGVQFHAA